MYLRFVTLYTYNIDRCVCKPGYQRISAHTCEDKNECDTPDMCQPNGTCVNLPGSYICDCLAGYRPSGQRCIGKALGTLLTIHFIHPTILDILLVVLEK
jgi:hypothetical protein